MAGRKKVWARGAVRSMVGRRVGRVVVGKGLRD